MAEFSEPTEDQPDPIGDQLGIIERIVDRIKFAAGNTAGGIPVTDPSVLEREIDDVMHGALKNIAQEISGEAELLLSTLQDARDAIAPENTAKMREYMASIRSDLSDESSMVHQISKLKGAIEEFVSLYDEQIMRFERSQRLCSPEPSGSQRC